MNVICGIKTALRLHGKKKKKLKLRERAREEGDKQEKGEGEDRDGAVEKEVKRKEEVER